ncbi:helix-turn-helix domain-containing protein [Spirosoma agri]|uniref:Helix-turn-helix transcriptional regulator n=1 Tax=Spirosoma agri TaxID=1987381 RepID=A0A6M0ICB2_9BACT|nr:helix-turn-helix transcriptional regulator [Spirosoma agri]NEU65834.1 helix-turn-helix transcriptional regulator [Spirosoma agri]
MTIAPFDLILLLGALQGFIVATLLWVNPNGNRLASRLLASLIGLLALMSFSVGIPVANRLVRLFIDLTPLIMAMPIGPLIFFYTRSVLDPSFRIGPRERRHFYPVVLDWGSPIICWVFITGMLLGFFPQQQGPAWGRVMNEYNTYIDIPRWLSCSTYLLLTGRVLRSQPLPTNAITDEQQATLRWLRQLVRAFFLFQAIWLVHLVPYIIPAFREPLLDRFGWYPIYIPIAVLIYWIGIRGYLHTRAVTATRQSARSVNSEIPEETGKHVLAALTKAMETDRLFLDQELTVEKLGQHTQVNARLISAVLNQHARKNFNSFVNEYRVSEVKHRLTDPAYDHLTLTGIAFESGFNSQATFQRTFKQLTGLSPGEYQAQQKKKAAQIRI